MPEPSFAELLDRSRRGDPDAARLLVERYEPAVLREVRFALADNVMRRVLDESDVCQSVMMQFFVGLWAGRFEFEGPGQLIGLLKTLVRRKVVDQARHWAAGRRDLKRHADLPGTGDPAEAAAPDRTPSSIAAGAELVAEFQRRLSEQERAILALRQQGSSWEEVSDRVGGAGPDALRKRFERALDRVGRELGLDG
jgi:RNA polymerase sigma-70 factor (ECF subfamily)